MKYEDFIPMQYFNVSKKVIVSKYLNHNNTKVTFLIFPNNREQ